MRYLIFHSFALLILILIAAPTGAITMSPLAPVPSETPYTTQYQKHMWYQQEAFSKAQRLLDFDAGNPERTANMDLYDVIFYDLDLEPDSISEILSGIVTVKARVLDTPLETMDLNFKNNMAVSAITAGGNPSVFNHSQNILSISLDRTYQPDEIVTLTVEYSGNPAGDHFDWGWYWVNDFVYTFSQPYGASDWWPCKDMNSDKADSVNLHITVSDEIIAACNGLLVSETVPAPGMKTYHWEERHPISTYLVAMTIYPFLVLNYTYTALDGTTTMPVDFYIIPQLQGQVEALYPSVIGMIEGFAQSFGEYPFLDEKYGQAHWGVYTAMENQTLSFFHHSFYYVWLQSHELSHQWFGDYVTCADNHHIWLNEGMATWCEAHWLEINNSMAHYHYEMDQAAYYGPGTIYVEDASSVEDIFDYDLSYLKGSWIPHMLRGQLGDEAFFTGLRTYLETYAHSSATTEQFRDVMAQVSGRNLDDFFQQWIYGEGHPQYLVNWTSSAVEGGTQVTVRVEQAQPEPTFSMQLPITVETTEGNQLFTFDNDQRVQFYSLIISGQVDDLLLDPDEWILCQITYGGTSDVPGLAAGEPRLLPNVPNPFNPSTSIRYELLAEAFVNVAIYDLAGGLVQVLESGQRQAGVHSVRWNGCNEQGMAQASGMYFVKLKAGKKTGVRKITLVQ